MSKSIVCLFSIENNYDQPSNNLVCWWNSKPDIETLFKAIFNKPVSEANDDQIVPVVNVWQNKQATFPDNSDWRLETVDEGEVIGE